MDADRDSSGMCCIGIILAIIIIAAIIFSGGDNSATYMNIGAIGLVFMVTRIPRIQEN